MNGADFSRSKRPKNEDVVKGQASRHNRLARGQTPQGQQRGRLSMSNRGGGGSSKASARWVETIVSSGSGGGGNPFQSRVEVGREGKLVRPPAIFLLPSSSFVICR